MFAPSQFDMFADLPPLRSRKQQRFADAILQGLSTREAIAASGSKAEGRSADTLASRWLGKVDVQHHLGVRRKLAVESANISAAMVLREVALIGFAARTALAGGFVVKTRDKLAALNTLAAYLGLIGSGGQTVVVGAEARADVVHLDAALRGLDDAEIRQMADALEQAIRAGGEAADSPTPVPAAAARPATPHNPNSGK